MQNLQKMCSERDISYIKSISYGKANDEQKYTTLSHKFHFQNCYYSSQMSLVRFGFQNNHGNQSSGEWSTE